MYRNFFNKLFSGTVSNLFRNAYKKYKPSINPLVSLTIGTFAIFHSKKYFMADDDNQVKTLR